MAATSPTETLKHSTCSWMLEPSVDDVITLQAPEGTCSEDGACISTWHDTALGPVVVLSYNTEIVGYEEVTEAASESHFLTNGPWFGYTLGECMGYKEGAKVITPTGKSIDFAEVITEKELHKKNWDRLLLIPPLGAPDIGRGDGVRDGASLQELESKGRLSFDQSIIDANQQRWDAIKDQKMHVQAVEITGMTKAKRKIDLDTNTVHLKPVTVSYVLTEGQPGAYRRSDEEAGSEGHLEEDKLGHGSHQDIILDRFKDSSLAANTEMTD